MSPRLSILAAALLCACSQTAQPDRGGKAADSGSTAPSASGAPETAAADKAPAAVPEKIDFAALVGSLSEPDANFFSDNYVSNETSYLQVASPLARAARPGGVYLGVGPEQNFTYIALTKPSLAFIVDIRRQNLVLHLLYKAVFDEATSRSHFLALLVGRPYEAATAPRAEAPIAEVIAHAERLPADETTFTDSHARLRTRIETKYGFKLDAKDGKSLEQTHRAFHKGQLDLRFELHQKNGRRYPMLRELVSQTDPDGKAQGFLASEESFRFVQRMQREDRIVPVVGDFGGVRALPGIAAYLRDKKLEVSTFYVSNVEQYLSEPAVWARWSSNIAALPIGSQSLFVRCWLDQGKRHPKQMKGHRTATTLHSMAAFNARQQKKATSDWWTVATEDLLESAATAAPERTATRP
jgi:hypothetical protein